MGRMWPAEMQVILKQNALQPFSTWMDYCFVLLQESSLFALF